SKDFDHLPSRIGITGSPATGKKSVGIILAKLLNLKFFSINDFAIDRGFGKWKGEDFLVDIKSLRGRIDTKDRIVSGHLLPYVIPNRDLDLIYVLRCSPHELRKRYESRGYSERKILENIEAEALGIIMGKCLQEYDLRKIAEVDMSRIRNPKSEAKRMLDIIKGRRKGLSGVVDWLSSARTPTDLESILLGKNHTLNKT
ncbi:MAG: adenylate kinase family protein, partial [Thaumarchaeota archaeon]|nr:adenylate kinase family protein [Nitrososphaerota archaeon]